MTNLVRLSNTQIHYFPLEKVSANFCQLKLLSNFIKYYYKKTVFKFSYVDAEGSLLGNLSLHENIKLSSDNIDIDNFSSFEIEQILEQFGNTYLSQLFKKVENTNIETDSVDSESKKIVALIKSFFRSGTYYLYHSPEKHLKAENLNLFLKALEFQSLAHNHKILIASNNNYIWNQFATHLVKRDNNKKFQVLPIIRHSESGIIIKSERVNNQESKSNLIIKNLDYKKAS